MAKARRKHKKGGKIQSAARRDVQLAIHPQLQAIKQAKLEAKQDYLKALQAAQSAYGGFQGELGNIPGYPLQDLSNQLQGQLGTLTDLLGGVPQGVDQSVYGFGVGLPSGEAGAGTGLFGQLGANALGALTSQAGRQAGYMQSAGEEGALAERYARENLLQDLMNQRQGFRQQRLGVFSQVPNLISQRRDELKQQAIANQSAQAYSNYLQQYFSGQTQNKPNKPKPPRRKPKGGGQDYTYGGGTTPSGQIRIG